MTFQTSLHFSLGTTVLFSHSGRVTDLLGSYDFVLVSGQKTTALFLFTFSLNDRKETSL
jgi:hypothetical protein